MTSLFSAPNVFSTTFSTRVREVYLLAGNKEFFGAVSYPAPPLFKLAVEPLFDGLKFLKFMVEPYLEGIPAGLIPGGSLLAVASLFILEGSVLSAEPLSPY